MSIIKEKDIKAICLDIDGTLYSKMQMNLRLALTLFPDVKLGLSFNKVRKLYRQTQEEFPPKTADRKGFLEKQAIIYLNKDNPTQEEIDKIIKKIEHQFYSVWAESFKTIKGFANMREVLLKAKQKGIKIALLSDFPIAGKVNTLGLSDIVDFATSTEESGYLKPSEKTFIYLINKINVDPKNCIYFGDSYTKDMVGAKKLNMQTLYISNKKKSEKYNKADYICKDWFEIEALLFN